MFEALKKLFAKKTIPVWDGNWEILPLEGEEFIYNGKVYTWQKCKCSNAECKRPIAYRKNNRVDRDVTIRLRGANQGLNIFDVIVKLGKMEELIKCGGAANKIADIFISATREIFTNTTGDKKAVKEYLQSKNITTKEMGEAALELTLLLTEDFIHSVVNFIR
jgi:hypothetical protein